MKSSNFNRGEDLEVFSLHPSCRGGDHYLAHKDGIFYIIKKKDYRRVTNMASDEGAVVYTLHPNCQGGDHYLSAFDSFYIIYQSRGVYRKTKNLHEDTDSAEYNLHPDCKDGLYYFGTAKYFYFVKPDEQWGIQYLKTTNLNTNEDSETNSFYPSVVNFLPGGFGVTQGPAYGEWVCIKTICNDSQTPVDWQKKITKKIGYEREKMCSIEHNWNVSTTISTESGGLSGVIAKGQFSFTAEYGGCSVNTEKEKWSEATDIEETISIKLQPHQRVCVWVYQLGLGKVPLLHCRDMRILGDTNPPTDVPLPPAANELSNRQWLAIAE